MANQYLSAAKNAKKDEFYTQFSDIQKEIEAYLEYDSNTFRGKVVYCNCDDPFESNFFRYFALNFNRLGLRQLITTSYKPSPIANTQLGLFGDDKSVKPEKGRPKITANKFIINEVHDMDGDGAFNISDIAEQLKANKNNEWKPLKGDGDFRSPECIELLKQSDIVVTNPPFSLFREYIKQIFEYNKKLLIIGNINAVTYKEIFPLIKENMLWTGIRFNKRVGGKNMTFYVPDDYPLAGTEVETDESGRKLISVAGTGWLTNLDHGRRHQPLSLMSMSDNLKYNKKMLGKDKYETYDNYDAIEVPFTNAIPSDYAGIMGVPISFLDKYNPDQFEIIGMCENEDLYKLKTKTYSNQEKKDAYMAKFGKPGQYDLNASGVVLRNGLYEKVYQRILIRHRKVTK